MSADGTTLQTMASCEWMYADVAKGSVGFHELSCLNPFRWSGPVSFQMAISDLEQLVKRDSEKSRPLWIKIPANTGVSIKVNNIQAGIEYLMDEDPVAKAEKAEQIRRREQEEKMAAAREAAERLKLGEEEVEAAKNYADLEEENLKSLTVEVENAKQLEDNKKQDMLVMQELWEQAKTATMTQLEFLRHTQMNEIKAMKVFEGAEEESQGANEHKCGADSRKNAAEEKLNEAMNKLQEAKKALADLRGL